MDKTMADITPDQGIFGGLFVLTNLADAVSNKYLKDLTTKQWFLLACLSTFFVQPPTLTQLAEIMGVSHQNVKMVALRLQEKQFLRLLKDPKDKRAWRVQLTNKPAVYTQESETLQNQFIERLYSGISDQEKRLTYQVLLQMMENVKRMKDE